MSQTNELSGNDHGDATPAIDGARASLNQVLWRELQALRPDAKKDFTPTSFVHEDRLLDDESMDDCVRKEQLEKLKTQRGQNLHALYERIGQMGRGTNATETDTPLSALCLSGGGIRSATFNLGVLQALARANLLGKFDYLSSVSGGGYIASWLSSWIHRAGCANVIGALQSPKSTDAPRNPLKPEPDPLDHLREFSNYLTPKLGLFSADTWTLAAIVVRNLILNWLVIVPLLGAMVALPQLFYLFVYGTHDATSGPTLLAIALAVELAASISVHAHRRFASKHRYSSGRIVKLCVIPIIAAAMLLASAALHFGKPWQGTAAARATWLHDVSIFAGVWCLATPLLGWFMVEVLHYFSVRTAVPQRTANAEERRKQENELERRKMDVKTFWHTARWEAWGIISSGVVASLLLYWMAKVWLPWLEDRPALYVALAVPCLLALYLVARTLFVAVASLSESGKKYKVPAAPMNDVDREWWARMSGWILGLTMMWILGASICVFAQFLLVRGSDWAQAAIAAAGGIAGVIGALLGSSDSTKTSDNSSSAVEKFALRFAAPVCAVCMTALIAWGTASLGAVLVKDDTVFQIENNLHRAHAPQPSPATTKVAAAASEVEVKTDPKRASEYALFAAVPATLALMAFALGAVINVNRFSLHGMYRNRLVRAYLGASNEARRPDPFTGFDPADNLRMHALHSTNATSKPAEQPQASKVAKIAAQPPAKLLPIINVTLNLLSNGKLAWQQRKAESFSITPFYCGNFFEGYRDSRLYGGQDGITLGTAITISGAAANPNMGYCSSPALAFLMATFNLRLGAWLGNTNRNGNSTYKLPGPGQALWAMIGELFGFTTKDFKYVNLSDGGHFDNLGLYEMVLRRCRHILVCDAGCDGKAQFEDLGNVIRKIRIDFGIPIVFTKIDIIPTGAADAGLYCATAEIQYPAIDGENVTVGHLVYVKPTLCGQGKLGIPYDIYSYAKTAAAFPHESTTDQWFSESQFESYRKLGEHSMEQVLLGSNPASVGDFVEQAGKYITAYATPVPSNVTQLKTAGGSA